MTFTFQTISEHSDNNPVFPNFVNNMNRWIQLTELDASQNGKLVGLYFKCLERVSLCFEIINELEKQHFICEQGWSFVVSQNTAIIPGILDLEARVENFLVQSKSAIRELTSLFNFVFGTSFNEAVKFASILKDGSKKDSEVLTYVVGNHPLNDEFADFLRYYQDHIAVINSLRNTSEHPEDRKGTLYITNYEIIQQMLIRPSWRVENNRADALLNNQHSTELLDGLKRIYGVLHYFVEGIPVFLIYEYINKDVFEISKNLDHRYTQDRLYRYDICLNTELKRALSNAAIK